MSLLKLIRKLFSSPQPTRPQLQTFILEPILTPSGLVDAGEDLPDLVDIDVVDGDLDYSSEQFEEIPFLEPTDLETNDYSDQLFTSGVFTVGDSGQVSFEFIFDGGGYEGELAIFSLEGMDEFEPGSDDFVAEAARRALTDSDMGKVVISDLTQAARFSGELGEANRNFGEYVEVETFNLKPGGKYALMLVPDATVERVSDILEAGESLSGSKQPLFSLATANPNDGFHLGQIADVDGAGSTFAMEDLWIDGKSDGDYNDIIFQVKGAEGEAVDLDQVIDPEEDWRDSEAGKELQEYVKIETGQELPVDPETKQQYKPGEILVKFSPDLTSEEIDNLRLSYGANKAESLIPGNSPLSSWYVLTFDEEADVLSIKDAIATNKDVASSQLNFVRTLDYEPNDEDFARNQWNLKNTGRRGGTVDADIDATEAWDLQRGSKDVVVAVIDSGVDYEHPDLEANTWTNSGEKPIRDSLDDDFNGYFDDIRGFDFGNRDQDPHPGRLYTLDFDYKHGTHVAGILGAVADNNIGIAGVSPEVSLMNLKVVNSYDSFKNGQTVIYTDDIVKAINYAVDKDADIINASLGGSGGGISSTIEFDAVSYANDNDVLFVASAGNDAKDNDLIPHYPASHELDNVISVAATDRKDELWFDSDSSGSNFGENSVDLGAPGVSIWSTIPGNRYDGDDGTSMAAPHVAGVAALLLAQDASLTAADLKRIILGTVDPLDSLQGKTVTGGRLNAHKALQAIVEDKRSFNWPWTYFGEDLNPDNTPLTNTPNKNKARNDFLSNLTNAKIESFENFIDGDEPNTLNFAGETATLTGNASIRDFTTGNYDGDGTYPDFGDKYLHTVSSDLTIEFDNPQSAFGFSTTDVGDRGGQLILTLHREDGSKEDLFVPHQKLTNPSATSFFGITDANSPFTAVTLKGVLDVEDGFSFDDFIIAQVEPDTLANPPETPFNNRIHLPYYRNTPRNLTNILVQDSDGQATVKLTLSKPDAGTLTTDTSGSVTSTYNSNAGIWEASGSVTDINKLLADLEFVPTNNSTDSLEITVEITDDIGSPLTGTIELTGIAVAENPATFIIPNTPYLSFDDSPFKDEDFAYFYLEDFEDDAFNTPGVNVSAGFLRQPEELADSVDGDDGAIDNSGNKGHSWHSDRSSSLTYTFDENILGQLPTHVGFVFTDVFLRGFLSLEAFDGQGNSLGFPLSTEVGDGSNNGTVQEDRFFGVVSEDGISAITATIADRESWELDHLQYGLINTTLPPIPDNSWIQQLGTSSYDSATGVTTDLDGNVYITGQTEGSLDGINQGNNDGFLSKYDVDGNLVWTEQWGSSSQDYPDGVTTDKDGNIYVTSSNANTFSAELDSSQVTFRKYDPQGNLVWSRNFTSPDGGEYASDVTTDSNGNIYITGWTSGSLEGSNLGLLDSFVAKYDSDGNQVWVQQLGSVDSDTSYNIVTDNNDNIYIVGAKGITTGNTTQWDVIFSKLNQAGEVQWTKSLGTPEFDYTGAIATDSQGNIYLTARTEGDLGGTNLGGEDSVLNKYDSDGNLIWSRQFGTSADDSTIGVVVDSQDNIYVTGRSEGNFGGTNVGSTDIYLRKYDSAGNLLDTQLFGTPQFDSVWDIAIDRSDNVYLAGSSDGSLGGQHAGGVKDAWVAKNHQGTTNPSGNVTVTINRVRALEAIDIGGEADFQGRVTINGTELFSEIDNNNDDVSPNWEFSQNVTGETVPITIKVYDEDTIPIIGDIYTPVDINPTPGITDLDLTYNLRTGEITGSGINANQGEEINLRGAGDREQTEIWFTINHS